jgi:hypothetical protein
LVTSNKAGLRCSIFRVCNIASRLGSITSVADWRSQEPATQSLVSSKGWRHPQEIRPFGGFTPPDTTRPTQRVPARPSPLAPAAVRSRRNVGSTPTAVACGPGPAAGARLGACAAGPGALHSTSFTQRAINIVLTWRVRRGPSPTHGAVLQAAADPVPQRGAACTHSFTVVVTVLALLKMQPICVGGR